MGKKWMLVRGGVPGSVIIIPEKAASRVELHAAAELRLFIKTVSGADMEISEKPESGKYGIWLGTPSSNPGISPAALPGGAEDPGGEGFLLCSGEKGLIIASREPAGVLYGVYAFLEEHLGVQWLFPGREGIYCPRTPDLGIPSIREVRIPAFRSRAVSYGVMGASREPSPDSWDWIARNRMSFAGMMTSELSEDKLFYRLHEGELEKRAAKINMGGHVLMKHVPDRLIASHPEYFALIGGRRRAQAGPKGEPVSQPCTTHPEVIRLTAEGIIRSFRENPAGGRYHFLNNDCGGWCECERCAALDPPQERNRPGGRVSTRYFTFVNEVSRLVWNEIESADIWAYAYQDFRLPPAGAWPDHRLGVVMCDHGRCFRHSLDDENCRANGFFRLMYESWAEFPNRMDNFSYYNCAVSGDVINRPAEKTVAADLRYMHRLGFKNWNIRALPPDIKYSASSPGKEEPARGADFWRANMFMLYIQAKLAWDPSMDEDEILLDLCGKFYGPASRQMYAFRKKLLEFWEETPGHFMYGADWRLYGKSLSAPGRAETLINLLENAKRAASGDEEYLGRVEKDRDIFDRTWLAALKAREADSRGPVNVPRAAGPVKVDGRLDEDDWEKCPVYGGFVLRGGKETASAGTRARFLHDGGNIYAGLEMDEPSGRAMVTEAREQGDRKIWSDDTVELFIDFTGKGDEYLHVAVNPAGVCNISICSPGFPESGNPAPGDGLEAAARVEGRMWTVEMKISAETFGGVVSAGNDWAVNAARSRKTGKREASSWSGGQFHDTESFRPLVFG